jgi:hypothetical protein
LLAVLVAGVGCASWFTDAALGAGGANIASAPSVAYGQQEFGNTVTDSAAPQCDSTGDGRSWWTLPVVAGDHIKVDLAGQTTGDGFFLGAYRLGVTDFNFVELDPYASTYDHQSDQEELIFSAPATGTMPMLVASCDSIGTYSFTANVTHGLVASLSVHAVNHRAHRTTFVVGAHTPDGRPLRGPNFREDIQLLYHGRWVTQATLGAPVTFNYGWTRQQRGKYESLRVRVRAPGYVTATSATVRIKGV